MRMNQHGQKEEWGPPNLQSKPRVFCEAGSVEGVGSVIIALLETAAETSSCEEACNVCVAVKHVVLMAEAGCVVEEGADIAVFMGTMGLFDIGRWVASEVIPPVPASASRKERPLMIVVLLPGHYSQKELNPGISWGSHAFYHRPREVLNLLLERHCANMKSVQHQLRLQCKLCKCITR
ncbi:hypothetical protein HPB51_011830 [Rhipicephalus microplus]|uniref:Uncharacterized protein n=1 Tax=Rhipicephalus microplus TaxID=6941 RepID=A0A9J6EG06_RHIMP|nr:hypothetical protein HPB51_011830 [Rhipicephalus microplus]